MAAARHLGEGMEAMTAISDKYDGLGGAAGFLGKPTGAETAAADGEGAFRTYEHGVIYWHDSTGAHEVHGAILQRWQALGLEGGPAGYPTTDETATPDGAGRFNHFQFASIYWHPATGAHDVHDLIRERWAMFGWETGFFGYPVSDQTVDGSGTATSRFQGGWISAGSTAGSVRAVRCPSSASPNYTVPVYAVQASDGNGKRKAEITPAEVQQWIDRANRVFEVAGIEFSYDGTLHAVKDTEINSVTGDQDPAWDSVKDKLNKLAAQEKKVVVVFRHGPDAAATGGGFSWSSYDFVVMPGFNKTFVVGKQNIALLAHELGHYLGLSHTHAVSKRTVAEARLHFAVNGFDPAVFDGDAGTVTDTPPDPHISELTDRFGVDTVTLGGVAFPLARYNALSYYHDKDLPPRTLTRQQVDRTRATLRERRTRGLTVAERWGASAEIQIYGATYQKYRARYDELWPDGWRLHLLEPYVVGSQVLYTAVWRWGPEPEIQLYGATYQKFRKRYDELWPEGWRLHLLEPYVVGNQVRYSAVWRRSTDPEVQVYGWTYEDFRERYDELWPEGWRLHLLQPYVVGNQVRYSAVWRRSTDPEVQVYGWTAAKLRERYDELWPEGWRLHLLEPYVVGNQVRYSAVWRRSTAAEIQLYGWKYSSYRKRYDELWPENWRLAIANVYVTGGTPRYAAVFRPLVPDYSSLVCGQSTTP